MMVNHTVVSDSLICKRHHYACSTEETYVQDFRGILESPGICFSRLPSNSEASASELLGSLEK